MFSTKTIYVDIQRLHSNGPDAVLIIQLMRAADDIALANQGLNFFKQDKPRIMQHVQLGARRYFIRLQCGHVSEGIKLIEEFNQRPNLISIVPGCPPHIQGAHQRLMEVLPNGSRRNLFEKWILPIRNRLAFHYEKSLFERAIKSRAERLLKQISSITRGSDIGLCRFGVADDIEDTIVCRLLWRIPIQADLRAEADRRADFGSDLCSDFLNFVGEIAFRYIKDNAAI